MKHTIDYVDIYASSLSICFIVFPLLFVFFFSISNSVYTKIKTKEFFFRTSNSSEVPPRFVLT